jgi:carbonic anhydrase
MCIACINKNLTTAMRPEQSLARRRLLKTVGLVSASALMGLGSQSYAKGAPPKPDNVLTPDQALERMMAGNARYANADSLSIDVKGTRGALSRGQNPYACVLSCADSRVSPELCFDEARGDLFVARVAGNFVNTDILASLEYAVAVLKSPLILVLGHTSCGAIDAAIKAYTQNATYPGHIQSLTTALAPAVREASKTVNAEGLMSATTAANVQINVEKLKESNPILSERVSKGQLKIVGGIYDLSAGRVKFLT